MSEHKPDPEFVEYLTEVVCNPYLSAATVMQMERVFTDQREKYEAQHSGNGEAVGIIRHINPPESDDPDAMVEWLFGGDEINLPHGTKLYTHPSASVPSLEWAVHKCKALQDQGFDRVRLDVLQKDFENTLSSFSTTISQPVSHGLYIGWAGWYTRKGGEKWYRCTVIAFDGGAPVIKTEKGHYHRRPVGAYQFQTELPSNGRSTYE